MVKRWSECVTGTYREFIFMSEFVIKHVAFVHNVLESGGKIGLGAGQRSNNHFPGGTVVNLFAFKNIFQETTEDVCSWKI